LNIKLPFIKDLIVITKGQSTFNQMLFYPVIIIAALLVARFYNGVHLFHTLAELFSIFVGLLMLVVVLNTQHFVKNDFLIYLGIGYFSISLIDAMHAFTVKGMPFFNIINGEITLHFWIYGRLFEAILLLSSSIFLTRNLPIKLTVIVAMTLVSIICWASFQLSQPIMFIDGGLSNFKIYTEFFVIALLLCTMVIFIRQRALLEKNVLLFLLGSLALTVVAELCFTLYTNFSGIAFIVGHVFKFLSFWMIYQAIIQTTLQEPLKLLTLSSNSYDAIPSPAIRIDNQTVIAQINQAALQQINKHLKQVIHQPIHTFFHPTSYTEQHCPFCQAIKLGNTITNKEVFFPQNGQWYLLSITPINSTSLVGGMVQSLTNISHQKQQEVELIEHKEHLEDRVKQRTLELEASFNQLSETQGQLVESKKMASLGGLVAGVAHEINTPIGIGITAASHLSDMTGQLKDQFDQNNISRKGFSHFVEEAEKSSSLMVSNLKRAAELIGSFKQVAVDQSNDCLRHFFLKGYSNEVLISLSAKLKKRSVTLTFDKYKDFEVYSSPSAVSQILTNFILNSLTHGFDESGNGNIIIEINQINGIATLIYQDSGQGMSEEDLKQIFEPFFTTKRGQGGSGLGLHIVYNLVHQTLKGTINCESTLDVGTKFTVTFPCHAAD